jgi:Ca2+-dependent lipid-binding protein
MVFGYTFVTYFNSGQTKEFIGLAKKLNNQENQFKNIFDNLETPVIICSESKAFYSNDSFLKQFQISIRKAKVTEVREKKGPRKCSRTMKQAVTFESDFLEQPFLTLYKEHQRGQETMREQDHS